VCVRALELHRRQRGGGDGKTEERERKIEKKKPENNFLHFFSFLRLRVVDVFFLSLSLKEGEERSLSTLFLPPGRVTKESQDG